jgi:peptidyl-prolyl cis-trans isomerase SurA
MVLNPKVEDAAEKEKTRLHVFDIYKKLQQGESFENLAKQFSEDKSSSSKGGVLARFGSGQLSSQAFEDVAFSLTNDKSVSEPFQTQFGWHIVKLIDKHPVKSFDEMRNELEGKVSKDERSRLIAASMNEKLRKQFRVKRDAKTYSALTKLITEDIYKGEWQAPAGNKVATANLFIVNNKNVSGTDFLNFVESQQKAGLTVKPLNKQVDNLYEQFVDQQLNAYYDENLEAEFPQFAEVMDEYRDGLLLFDLMEKEIWEKSKTDTLGLKKFYEANSAKYRWTNRLDAIIVSSTKQDVIKKAQKFLKKNKTPEYIREQLNTKETVNVMTKTGIYEENSDAIPKNIKWKTGVSDVIKDGDYYFVVKVNKLLPAGPKTLDEAKGRAINDYQQYLEENWVRDLKNEFTVVINQDVFTKLKKQMQP